MKIKKSFARSILKEVINLLYIYESITDDGSQEAMTKLDEAEDDLALYVSDIPEKIGLDRDTWEELCPECCAIGGSWTPKFVLAELEELFGMEV